MGKQMKTQLWAIGLVLLACLIGSFGALFLKLASKEFSFNIKKIILDKFIYLGVLFYAAGTILFIPALKGGELSVLYPLVSTSYIWVCLLSMKFLKEKMNPLKWIGIAIIILGVIFMGLGS